MLAMQVPGNTRQHVGMGLLGVLIALALLLALAPSVVGQVDPSAVDPESGPLVSGTPVQGKITPLGDTDEYTIAGKANQWITIEVLGGMGLRPQVEVLYPNGALFTETHGDLMAKKSVQLMTGGVYTVVVKSYPYPSQTTGTYTLTVTTTNQKP